MILFPAVDIKDGKCVRLKQGKENEVTVFSQDPVAMAKHWAELGAKWLHIVDLDGAFSGKPRNNALIEKICSTIDIPVQLGGGVRDLSTARSYLDTGVKRILIGTMAIEDPAGFATLCSELPQQVGVSLDAAEGQLKTRGWVGDSGQTVRDVVPRLEEQGAAFLVYTDIARDGMHSGVNVQAMEDLLSVTRLPVIAAGGVSTLEDIKTLAPLAARGLEGVITGRAIYEGSLDFADACQWIEDHVQEQ